MTIRINLGTVVGAKTGFTRAQPLPWALLGFITSNKTHINLITSTILTHLAYRYIANGKKCGSVLQQITEQKCVSLFGAVL